jgi:hypothetical protein
VRTFYKWTQTITNLAIITSLLLRLWAGRPTNRGSISNWDKIFRFSPKRLCWLWDPASPLLSGYLGPLLRIVKQITHVRMVTRIRMSGALPPFPIFLWHAQGLYLACKIIRQLNVTYYERCDGELLSMNVKVKFFVTRYVGKRVSWGIAPFIRNHDPTCLSVVKARLSPHCTAGWVDPRTTLDGRGGEKVSCPTGVGTSNRQA